MEEFMMRKILDRFQKDCFDDIAELQTTIQINEIDKVRLIVHRLAGRTAQIGATELGKDFRILEQEIASQSTLQTREIQQLNLLVLKLEQLIKFIQDH